MGFLLLVLITFLSAFLLFQIELILGKLLLPQYGGSYLVWGACVVFFQGVLLAGYIGAHRFISQMGVGRYLKIHAFLLLLPLLFFPGQSLHLSSQQSGALPLVVDIFWRLLLSIGPVFFVLSTISLVTQTWLAQSALTQRANPYPLYAVSNLGSFLALLTYPFIVEFNFGLSDQLLFWRVGYLALLVLSFIAFWKIKTNVGAQSTQVISKPVIPIATLLRWLVLSASGVVMFLSVTSMITYEIAPVPLLWIVPLSLYLLTFVFNFGKKPFIAPFLNQHIGIIIGLNVAIFFLVMKSFIPTIIMAFMLCALLFDLCMYAQRALIQSKPQAEGLTLFYVMISLGGFLGGVLATWIVPLVSTMLVEFLLGLLLIALGASQVKKRPLWMVGLGVLLVIALLWGWPLVFKKYSLFGVVLLFGLMAVGFYLIAAIRTILIASLVVLVVCASFLEGHWKGVKYVAKHRNYYGIYQIYDKDNIRLILHGTTLHGVQFNTPKERYIPIGYYSPNSAIGGLIIRDYFNVKHMGLIGLGAGTITMYANPLRSIDVYELDPDVLTLAKKHFTYLEQAPGPVNVVIGDARISLKQTPHEPYDLLIVDAFGGDAIPVHLINADVVKFYQHIITPTGVIAFHITNRYIDLKPLLANIARDLGAWVAVKEVADGGVNMRSIWAVMTWDKDRLLRLINEDGWQLVTSNDFSPMRSWTDDYSSVLPLLKQDEFVGSLTHFKWWSL